MNGWIERDEGEDICSVSQTASISVETLPLTLDRVPLPEGWRLAKLLEIADRLPTGTQYDRSSCKTEGRVPIVDQSESGYMGFHDNEYGAFASEEHPIVTFANHTCAVRLHENPFSTIQNVFPLKGKEGVDTRFLYWLLVNRVPPSFYGGHYPKLIATDLPLPPFPEQKRIAAILKEQTAAVERARAAAEAQLKAAKDLPAAYLREIFDSTEAHKWIREKLGNVSVISGGIQKTPNRKPKSFHRPYLTVRNVQRGYLDLSALERFEITESELDRLRLMYGDILIVEGNGSLDHIGRNALFRGEVPECIHQNHIIRVRLDEQRFIPEFVSRFLNSDSGKTQMIQKAMTTSGLYTLSAGKVAALEIPTPSIKRQREIVETLNEKIPTAENTCEVITNQLDSINKLPAALLRQAFTGKI